MVKSWAFSTLSSLKLRVQRCQPLDVNPKPLKPKADYEVNIPTFQSRPYSLGKRKKWEW